jgi:hypothetical protein
MDQALTMQVDAPAPDRGPDRLRATVAVMLGNDGRDPAGRPEDASCWRGRFRSSASRPWWATRGLDVYLQRAPSPDRRSRHRCRSPIAHDHDEPGRVRQWIRGHPPAPNAALNTAWDGMIRRTSALGARPSI